MSGPRSPLLWLGCWCSRVLLMVTCLGISASPVRAQLGPLDQALTPEAALREAQRLFDNAEYERALPFLDRAVTLLEPLPTSAPTRSQLFSAYELRARTHFGIGNRDGARADFETLLRLAPNHARLSLSPAIQAFFDEIAASILGQLQLTVWPADADVEVDGVRVKVDAAPLTLLTGTHTVKVSRTNHRSQSEQVVVSASTAVSHVMRLERLFARVRITTVPHGVEVRVNGIRRGLTSRGSASTEMVDWARANSVPVDRVSAPFDLDELSPGTSYTVSFSQDCFAPLEVVIQPDKASDTSLSDPVVLTATVGRVDVTSSVDGTFVYLDGEPRGNAPLELSDVCEGRHVLQMRTPYGRDVRRLDIRRDARIAVKGEIRPAFALVVVSGGPRATEIAQTVEGLLSGLSQLTVFAPDEAALDGALKGEQVSLAALAVDAAGQPLGNEATRLTRTARSVLSQRLCRAFDEAQGILSVTELDATGRLTLAWWACGSATPDVFTVKLDEPSDIGMLTNGIDAALAPVRPSLGLRGIDVAGLPGVVIADAESGAALTAAGLEPGDVITAVNGVPVTDERTLDRLLLESPKPAADVSVKTRGGESRTVSLAVVKKPRLIGLTDRTFVPNPAVARLRAMAASSRDPAEATAVGLNLAVVLMKVEAWAEALSELQKLRLPDGPGISAGTVKYLVGLCHEALGQRLQAQEAWQGAQLSDGLLTEDGPPVAPLARAKIRAGR